MYDSSNKQKNEGENFSRPARKAPGVETLSDYLSRLASESPTPGGGSAATMVAAAGAALVAMVARICAGNTKYALHADLARDLIEKADALRKALGQAGERDEAAFDRVVAATAMPKTTDDEKRIRREALDVALAHAAAEPLHAAATALDVMRLAERALVLGNDNLVSDLGSAAEFASAALAACAYNVRINHRFMRDETAIDAQAGALTKIENEAASLLASTREAVQRGLSRR
jgi:formiminotetrahydrofolate cyclodeaminase